MAAAETSIVDLTSTTTAIKESNSKLDYAAQASAKENKKTVDAIGTWAKSNEMKMDGLAMSNLSGDANQMNATVAALAANMESQEMGAGEMYDELKSMHIGLADAFEQQYNFDVERWRTEKEMLDEANRKKTEKAEGKEATDFSLDWNPLTIIAAVTGFIVGFFQGFFGPLGVLLKGWTVAIKNWFKAKGLALWKPLSTWFKNSFLNTWFKSFKAFFTPTVNKAMSMKHHTKIMNESGIMKIYKSIKAWFGKKLTFGWTKVSGLVKESTIGKWVAKAVKWFTTIVKFGWTSLANLVKKLTFYTKVKAWFTAKGFKMPNWQSVKALFAESKVARLFKSIKAFFSGGTGAVIPKIKALFMKSPIGVLINSIKGLFKTKPPGSGIMDDVTKLMTKLFGKGGVFNIFRKIGAAFGKIFFFVQIFMTLFDFYTGFVETEGNLLDKILGGLKAAFVGFFGGFMDLGIMLEDGIKWIIKKIAGFFGFDEDEVAASMESFSIFKPLKQMVTDIADWFVGLFDFSSFSAGLISMAKLIFLPFTALIDLVGFVWDWFMELFGWKDENAPADDRTLTTKLGDLLLGVWDWFMGIFGFDLAKSTPADDGQTVFGKLTGLLAGAWDWFLGIFGFGEGHSAHMPADDGQTVMGKLLGLVTGVWTWFKGLFGFSSPEDDADTVKGVGGFLKDLVDGVWGYFKKLFQFGSIGDVMKSYFNLLTFFPNIIKDAIAGVTSWLLGLFGFDEAAKTVANAQNFSLGDMIFNAIKNIWDWFKGLLDIDVASIAKGIPGAETLLSWMGDSAAEKNVEGMTKAGLMKSDEGTLDADQIVDIGKLQGMMKGMSLEGIKNMMMEMKEINESDMIGKGDEIANWEVVQKTLQEGAKLAALQKESNELSGSGSATTIIQDNSQNVSSSSQPIVIPTSDIAPGNSGNVLQQ